MNRLATLAAAVSLAAVLTALGMYLYRRADASPFVEVPLPLQETARLFDIGVVDANQDGLLDIYTSNHHFRQVLLLAQPNGGYRDVLSEWGLDQSRDFPLAELSFITPKVDRPGVYVYWRGTNLVIERHQPGGREAVAGQLHTFDPVEIVSQEAVQVEKHETRHGIVTETLLKFSLGASGRLVMQPGGQGLPIDFTFSDHISPAHIYVGRGKVSPNNTHFSLAMQDRHAHAWADFNDDGLLDIFINRGALSGTLRAHKEAVARAIKDELFLSTAIGRFVESSAKFGLEKKGCSGRHAKWVDYNRDGLLDLYVNCHDRGKLAGEFPKQLYRQEPGGRFREVASEAGLALPDRLIKALAWLDVDNDGWIDLLTLQEQGVYLYRNQQGHFEEQSVYSFSITHKDGIQPGGSGEAWVYDGHLTVGDFNGDGHIDVFVASTHGNILLRNIAGGLVAVIAPSIGLPAASRMAQWTDYDNDGRLDLHLFPQGIYHQRPDGQFVKTGWLSFPDDRYRAAIINWFDIDNDGRRDVLLALAEPPSDKSWWRFWSRPGAKGRWKISAYRNTFDSGHWLQVEVRQPGGSTSAPGTRITVETADGQQTLEVGASEGSIFSQGHYRLYFGLGASPRVQTIYVRWSNGSNLALHNIAANKILYISPPR